jgi:hypothetical protein
MYSLTWAFPSMWVYIREWTSFLNYAYSTIQQRCPCSIMHYSCMPVASRPKAVRALERETHEKEWDTSREQGYSIKVWMISRHNRQLWVPRYLDTSVKVNRVHTPEPSHFYRRNKWFPPNQSEKSPFESRNQSIVDRTQRKSSFYHTSLTKKHSRFFRGCLENEKKRA